MAYRLLTSRTYRSDGWSDAMAWHAPSAASWYARPVSTWDTPLAAFGQTVQDPGVEPLKPGKKDGKLCGNTLQHQRLLVELGYNTGGIDGIVGTETEKAIRQFSRDYGAKYGLPTDSGPTPEWCRALRIEVASRKAAQAAPTTTAAPEQGEGEVAAGGQKPAAGKKGWWDEQSDDMKAFIIGSAIVVIAGAAYLYAARRYGPRDELRGT